MVCPADAIKVGEDGVVRSALKPRCIACSNCVLACPFGIPKVIPEYEQMMKCDMCYDRTSVGKKPMCATVCPSQALSYVKPEEIAQRREEPENMFVFGNQRVKTRVNMMVPPGTDAVSIDVIDYMWEGHLGQAGNKTPTPRDQESLWRDEFSVFEERERFVNRRQLIKFLTLTSLGMFVGNIWILVKSWFRHGETYPHLTIARAGEIPVGGVKLFRYPNSKEQCLLVRDWRKQLRRHIRRSVRISPAPFIIRVRTTNSSARATMAAFRFAMAPLFKGRLHAHYHTSFLERRGDEIIATGMSGELES